MTTGIILFAHGSRDAHWRVPIEAVALQISQRSPSLHVRCAYLELCSPSLPDAATELIALNIKNIRVFPLFLGVGKHVREDMPLLIEEIRAAHPDIEVELLASAGEYAELTAVLADIALSAVSREDKGA